MVGGVVVKKILAAIDRSKYKERIIAEPRKEYRLSQK
jgi:hypothetical protein